MCGILGCFSLTENISMTVLAPMLDKLSHRGPDHSEIFVDKNMNVGLAHARLSIIDLSSSGNQPMSSTCNRFTIVYNGEIYNHLELRKLFTDYNWNGVSDTETLLLCLQRWGLLTTLENLEGMFSFGLLDREKKTLTLCRDRFGEKPLYYGKVGQYFIFASELGAIKAHPNWHFNLNENALNEFLQLGAIQSPNSIFQNIQQLEPGKILTLDLKKQNIKQHHYWNLKQQLKTKENKKFNGTFAEAVTSLDQVLNEVVKSRMISDVPIGAFLSGGIDSSLIVAIMQAHSNRAINTFTVGFESKELDESLVASKTAKLIGTNHETINLSEKDILNTVMKIPEIFTEPFGDTSQIPTYLVSRFASQHVKVALSGDGGDELFCGYNRHIFTNRFWPVISKIPSELRISIINSLTPEKRYYFLKKLAVMLNISNPYEAARKIELAFASSSEKELYVNLLSGSLIKSSNFINSKNGLPKELLSHDFSGCKSPLEKICLLDFLSYLPNDILVKVDRSSMANSLEVRSPFLSPKLLNISSLLPIHYKIKGNKGKLILRKILQKYVGNSINQGPKKGFGTPIGEWMNGPLKDWVEHLLEPDRMKSQGHLLEKNVAQLWRNHKLGNTEHQKVLWNIIMFQAWLDSQKR